MGIQLSLVALECFQLYRIKQAIAQKKTIPQYQRYINAFFETNFPTIFLILFSFVANDDAETALLILSSPGTYLYFIFIILSTLRLDPRLCLFTGFVAASGFSFLVWLYTPGASEPQTLLTVPEVHLIKTVLLLLAGFVAGFVALQLRQRMHSTYQSLQERNNIKNLFGQQVSHAVVEALLATPDDIVSRKQTVTVMFLDIRNYTPFAESRSPEEIVNFLNALFSLTTDSVIKYNGIINQFLGDGFMATFGAPLSQGNDAQHAIDASLEILEKLESAIGTGELPQTRLGIGLHSGEVITGNIGPEARRQYSITGNTVILAARIEQLTKQEQAQVLISEDVYQRLDSTPSDIQDIGEVELKGRSYPTRIYKLA